MMHERDQIRERPSVAVLLGFPLPGRFWINLQLFPQHGKTCVFIDADNAQSDKNVRTLVINRTKHVSSVDGGRQRRSIQKSVEFESFSTRKDVAAFFRMILWSPELGERRNAWGSRRDRL